MQPAIGDEAETLRYTHSLRKLGYAVLRDAFPAAQLARTANDLSRFSDAAWIERYASTEAMLVGEQRYQVTPPFTGAIASTEICRAPKVVAVLERLLGLDLVLASVGAVIAMPGAAQQHTHRDFQGLFPETQIDAVLPTFAVTVIIPLVEVTEENGPTLIWPGSNRNAAPDNHWDDQRAVRPLLQVGDCLMMDYRVVHAGAPNRSNRARPILYNVYSRPWFRDHLNYRILPRIGFPEISVRPDAELLAPLSGEGAT